MSIRTTLAGLTRYFTTPRCSSISNERAGGKPKTVVCLNASPSSCKPRGAIVGEPDAEGILINKFKIASREQRVVIIHHRSRLARHLGRAVSIDEAARDWILSYAAEWRAKFEEEWQQPTVR